MQNKPFLFEVEAGVSRTLGPKQATTRVRRVTSYKKSHFHSQIEYLIVTLKKKNTWLASRQGNLVPRYVCTTYMYIFMLSVQGLTHGICVKLVNQIQSRVGTWQRKYCTRFVLRPHGKLPNKNRRNYRNKVEIGYVPLIQHKFLQHAGPLTKQSRPHRVDTHTQCNNAPPRS